MRQCLNRGSVFQGFSFFLNRLIQHGYMLKTIIQYKSRKIACKRARSLICIVTSFDILVEISVRTQEQEPQIRTIDPRSTEMGKGQNGWIQMESLLLVDIY